MRVCLRALEQAQFNRALTNAQLLFHGSPAENVFGILSRGLLPPAAATSKLGIARRDAGNLGAGLYYSSSFGDSVQYTSATSAGTRYMLVSTVALGRSFPMTQPDRTLTGPPVGFDSCVAVPRSRDSASFFGSEELVVYSLAQQRLQYLVAFRVGPSTAASPAHPTVGSAALLGAAVPDADADGDSSEPLPDSSRLWGLATDVSDEAEPQAPQPTAQTGLLTSSGSKLPLKSHHVRARILDLLAEVSVVQEFQNESAGTHAVCRRGCVGCLGGFRVFCCSLCCAQLAAALYRVCRV